MTSTSYDRYTTIRHWRTATISIAHAKNADNEVNFKLIVHEPLSLTLAEMIRGAETVTGGHEMNAIPLDDLSLQKVTLNIPKLHSKILMGQTRINLG